MILRLDDTDVERNTDASVNSIFEGLKWLGLSWDEQYQQSERGELHRQMADAIFQKGLAYRDFTPAHTGDSERSGAQGTWLFNPGMRELSREESDRRAAAGEQFALRFRVPRQSGEVVRFTDAVYGEQIKAGADIEDFALLRSDGMPTYHLASCADDADLRISHIIRGQDHLSNTYKHVLIFEAAGFTEKRSRADEPPGTGRRILAPRNQSRECSGELQGEGFVKHPHPERSQGRGGRLP
jgi:glutamyl-tRNA synthetase